MTLVKAMEYSRKMREEIEPALSACRKEGYFERKAGEKIYYEHFSAEESRGRVVLVHGFSEGIDKFHETVWYFLQMNLNVWVIQQRGHGLSYREVKGDPSLIHIGDYNDLVEDLAFFVREVVKKEQSEDKLPLYLYAHSMGGGVSACYLERYPGDVEKAILSSPMLEMNAGDTPVWVAAAAANVLILFGKGKGYLPGAQPFSDKPDFENSCTNCRERYDDWFERCLGREEYHMCASSVGTAREFLRLTKEIAKPKNEARVNAKVRLFQAGMDNMVSPGGQDAFISALGPNGRLVRFEQAKHEIYRCDDTILERYWGEIETFLRG